MVFIIGLPVISIFIVYSHVFIFKSGACPCWFVLSFTGMWIFFSAFVLWMAVFYIKFRQEQDTRNGETAKKQEYEKNAFDKNQELRVLEAKLNALNRMADTIQKGSNNKELEELEKILKNLLKASEKD